jgi:calcineurin-like phosphoesterase family protein
MKTFITSDLHFGHSNIKKFCAESRARFSDDVDLMNEQMIMEWNELIGVNDVTYILGDVAFLPTLKAISVVKRLHGQKILIEGNHDRKALRDPVYRSCFKEIHHILNISYAGTKVVMCHYPFLEWDQMHRGSVHFHGHLHGNPTGQEQYRCRDMGMDATGEIAITMEEAIASVVDNEIKAHHQTGE